MKVHVMVSVTRIFFIWQEFSDHLLICLQGSDLLITMMLFLAKINQQKKLLFSRT